MASRIRYAHYMHFQHASLADYLAKHEQLMKAVNNLPGLSKLEVDEDAILLRAYGKGTDVLIDRESM
jgi:hypothetical protein